jgi:hypothetical protein
MTLRNILLALGGAAALIHVTSYILIMAALDRRGYKTNALLARLYFFRYVSAYREATVKETGRPGTLYTVCISAIVLALVFVATAVLLPRG